MKSVILPDLQPLLIAAVPEEERQRQSFWAILEQKAAIF